MGAWLKVSLPFLLLFFSSFSVSFFFLALLHFNVRQDRELQYFLQDLNSESQVVTPLVIIIYSGMKPKQQKVIEQTQPVLQGMGAWGFILSALKKTGNRNEGHIPNYQVVTSLLSLYQLQWRQKPSIF